MSAFDGLQLAAEDFPKLRTLESFPDVIRGGYVTVCEINGELQVALSADPDSAADSVGFTNLTEHYVPIYGDNLKPSQTQKIPSIKIGAIDEPFLADPTEDGLKAVWNAWYVVTVSFTHKILIRIPITFRFIKIYINYK